ncbi:MAG: ribbon-helix-helix protein, CopG family [Deltaproteobacteria bacterium]|nr:ribbon-helix-helix protein, CopG family [Deltaproteobacteria bacterium]MBW1930493.1 ribbon-helix-helix protein, CopG family [Deltaproteobacteria bacterium]MBW2025452.1 ribbon-helix-helix protein, CopG family [Deltaproteobacteria bacterium]MBW2126104.1 ribbon-helix-helix protein, CopG family [Deltaproteobacteria bacterium]RLB14385.1 MAG: hypothetical protein DRG63_08585 [Deltaproteobacteria bacterium]
MENISIKVPESLITILNAVAKETGKSRSAIIRLAIEKFLREENKSRNSSCLDLSKDLAGCVEGAWDLSFNPKHMKGYGK